MKKHMLTALIALLLCSLAQAADFSADITFDKDKISQRCKQKLSNLTEYFKKTSDSKDSLFANKRVNQMCLEWAPCIYWADNKKIKDSSFQIIDAEVERWVSKWQGQKAIWEYKLHVKTIEKGQTKSYVFKRDEKGHSYSTPEFVKVFPGHPIAQNPSEHINHTEYKDIASYDASAHTLCNAWYKCKAWAQKYNLNSAVISQYIYKYDENQNPLWKRRLYVEYPFNESWIKFSSKVVYFQAYQTQFGGEYVYQDVTETTSLFPMPSGYLNH